VPAYYQPTDPHQDIAGWFEETPQLSKAKSGFSGPQHSIWLENGTLRSTRESQFKTGLAKIPEASIPVSIVLGIFQVS
jgi:hypothetical protein